MILYLKSKSAILSCCRLNKIQKEFLAERYVEKLVHVNRYRLLNLINSYLLLIPIIVPFVSSQQFSSIFEMVGFKLHAMTRTISWRGRLVPNPFEKDSIEYVQTKPYQPFRVYIHIRKRSIMRHGIAR